ncbi:MAG TPA: hypothetical protein PKY22_01375, partial [Accumulibacter sp.]|nr:hypothetical protein [Accumulibacter sp.]
MKEHQISFSAPMVRAILEGRKTQTRRVLKPQPRDDQIMPRYWSGIMKYEPRTIYGGDGLGWWAIDADGNDHEFRCPYRQPGDRLLVLEEYRELDYGDVGYYADGSKCCVCKIKLNCPTLLNWSLPSPCCAGYLASLWK